MPLPNEVWTYFDNAGRVVPLGSPDATWARVIVTKDGRIVERRVVKVVKS